MDYILIQAPSFLNLSLLYDHSTSDSQKNFCFRYRRNQRNETMHHRLATRFLWCIFSFTGTKVSLRSFRLDFPKERTESKSLMVTTPFNFIILCAFFTFFQYLQLLPPLIRNAMLQNFIEFHGMQEIYLRVRLAMNSNRLNVK